MALRVLIVDDDEGFLDFLADMLGMLRSTEVTTAKNGVVALEKLKESRGGFDLIMSDTNMPEMDGFELCNICQVQYSHTPFVSMTGKERNISELKKQGVQYILKKLFSMNELKEVLDSIFGPAED